MVVYRVLVFRGCCVCAFALILVAAADIASRIVVATCFHDVNRKITAIAGTYTTWRLSDCMKFTNPAKQMSITVTGESMQLSVLRRNTFSIIPNVVLHADTEGLSYCVFDAALCIYLYRLFLYSK